MENRYYTVGRKTEQPSVWKYICISVQTTIHNTIKLAEEQSDFLINHRWFVWFCSGWSLAFKVVKYRIKFIAIWSVFLIVQVESSVLVATVIILHACSMWGLRSDSTMGNKICTCITIPKPGLTQPITECQV